MKGNFFVNSFLSFFGEMTAELLSGYLSGIYGRTTILKFGGIVGAFGFLGNQLCPYNLKSILLSMICITSGFVSAIYGNFSLYVAEYIPKESSAIAMSFIDAVYPFMGFLEALYFLTINNWRLLFLFTTLIHVISTFFILKYLPESPKWLYSKGKINEAIEVMKQIATINGKENEVQTFLNLNGEQLNDNNEENENNNEGEGEGEDNEGADE